MKFQTILIAAIALVATAPAADAALPAGSELADNTRRVKELKAERSENNLFISIQLDLSSLNLKSDREITFIPVLSSEGSRIELPRIVVAGHNRYIQNQRHGKLPKDATLCRTGKVIPYSTVIPFETWMETATLSLVKDECGCGFTPLSSRSDELAVLDFTEKMFRPEYAFITPEAEVKQAGDAVAQLRDLGVIK